MRKWIETRAKALQAMAAIDTMTAAVAALVGVKVQIDANARQQRKQSARDIYREYLNISMSKPEFSAPDYCAIAASPQYPAYQSYMSYLLYTGEQVFALGEGWDEVMQSEMEPHAAYLCSSEYKADDFDPKVQASVQDIRGKQCATIKPCEP